MKEIWGLPAHPLFVHAPIVLVPLLTLGVIAVAVRPRWRAKGLPLLAAGAFIAAVTTLLASQSGQAFAEAVPEIGKQVDRHEELAETAQLLVFGLPAILVITAFVLRRARVGGKAAVPAWLVHGLPVVSALVGLLATVWMVRAGHEGAEVVWGNTELP
jgi:uncharacterized membrane protein